MRQLPLGVQLGVSLRRLADDASRTPVWFYGPSGSGKSHLLQAACAAAGNAGRATAYLPLSQLPGQGPGLLDGFERLDLVALDDLDVVAGAHDWELALFALFNGLAEQGGRLALAAAGAPAATAIRLPDLASRLAASEVHRLEPLAESAQPEALRRRAERRGLELPDETLGFLTRRAPRDFATLCRMLDALDAESLAAQRRLTVPFVRDWLARNEA